MKRPDGKIVNQDRANTDFIRQLDRSANRIERILSAELTPRLRVGEMARPERLVAAMRHSALAGGKRLRPFLTVETAKMLGMSGAGAWLVSAAIECLHCYSLVHDDLPAMDNDDLRRGKPTVHRAYDEATAILAGDALMTLAFDMLARPQAHPDANIRAELVLGLARAGGLGGMAGGQMLDLAAEGRFGTTALDVAAIRRLQAMKTGALLAFSVDAGAILSGADRAERKRLKTYGTALGAAFQIADDILDREADATTLGKAVGKDLDKGKATLVDLLGIETARQEAADLASQAISALKPFGHRGHILAAAARFVISRSN
jgi:farnesyl diphosphate synthase